VSHFKDRVYAETARLQTRRAWPLDVRLRQALERAALLTDTDAATIGRETARVQAGASPPPPDNSLHSRYERKLRLLMDAFERDIDAECYRPVSADLPQETIEQREQRLINEFEGIPSYEVTFLDGSFGSPRSVERIRSRWGRKPTDGTLREVQAMEAGTERDRATQ
jgi:hypothetical protein